MRRKESDYNESSHNKGFTLIEVLIVVVIVGLLSTLAIGSYSQYRKASLLNIAADNIVSSLYGARSDVKFGAVSSRTFSTCEGLLFESVPAGQGANDKVANDKVKRISTPYSDKKKWINDGWQVSGCDSSAVTKENISLDDLVGVEKLSLDGVDVNSCGILFVPSDGRVVLIEGCSSYSLTGGVLAVTVKYGENDNDSSRKIIEIDLKNAIANVKNSME